MKSLQKFLVTGFEAFGNNTHNISGQIANSLDGYRFSTGEAIGTSLPVSYHESYRNLASIVQEENPRGVILLGLNAGAPCLMIESQARNWVGKSEDETGDTLGPGPIIPGAPDFYQASLPMHLFKDKCDEYNLMATISHNAGDYVCNYLFYRACYALGKQGIPVGFIHLPLRLDEGTNAFRDSLLSFIEMVADLSVGRRSAPPG